MSSSETIFDSSLSAVLSAMEALPTDLALVKQLDDPALLAQQRRVAEASKKLNACASLIAGEIGHRSRRDLGYSGLAQREGFRTPEALVQFTTGSTAREATTLVQIGTMVYDSIIDAATDTTAPDAPVHEPWLRAVGAAVSSGTLSLEAARAIRAGLGNATVDANSGGVTAVQLAEAASALLEEAAELNADQLYKRARALRDDLDAAGIANRERAIYQERSFRRVKRPNGLSRFILDPDLETSAYLDDVYDKLTSPRRGGPRFIDEADKAWAETVANDDRTLDQYLHDAFTALLRLGVGSDQSDAHLITGSRTPAVRVLVTGETLRARSGHGRIEGIDIPVSIETVERNICTSGTVEIEFGTNGQPLDLGREVRLFNNRQKIALAVRDGGCMWPGCDRPPTWTEAHHTKQWVRDHGGTDVADGLCLCRHHHMLLHDNHWEIIRKGAQFWLIPPPDIDSAQTPRPLESKSAILKDLQREATRQGASPGSTRQRSDFSLAGPPT
ncbi:HNH endonuclease signature motif containing protein [Parafrigoribacterium mesophilum]|uniref:HNH endonuclease signature motif containing protein n=1 Tax=Parafrigoribacterium mesophilum TaxID=433646 RepID=UPI0031FE0D74